MRTTVYITHGGAEARSWDAPGEPQQTIIIGESADGTARIQLADYRISDPEGWLSISVADLRAYLQQREESRAWIHDADDLRKRQADSRLGQSAQIEEVK